MATTTLQHPSHDHPLVPLDFSNGSLCHLCHLKISADGYTCQECEFYVHRVCAESPPRIDCHPLHPDHPLTLVHGLPPPRNDQGGSKGKTPEQIDLPLHPHTLTSFSMRQDFVGEGNCVICKTSVEQDGYMCLLCPFEFKIHKGCIHDLYYVDGTKAPRIYHGHPLKTFLGEDTGSCICANRISDASSGEFIGCGRCEVFFHRDCISVPEIIQYPHHPDHTLVLFVTSPANDKPQCDSCSCFLEGELCYGCPSCEFFVEVKCALQVLAYWKEGMYAKVRYPWHEHALLLCHRTEHDWGTCNYCEDKSAGPMYACEEEDCEFLLHKRCIKIESTIIHPHHPDHPLTLGSGAFREFCKACCEIIYLLNFYCELCEFYLHAKCVAHVPTRKHYLHEHELLYLDKAQNCECNICGISTDSTLFRCVPCNFNLHEECMKLPEVVKSEIHWHPLTLRETFLEDDSGEYYCEHCEKRRDGRLGVYVCGECKISLPRIYHIECVLPKLGKAYAKKIQASVNKRMAEKIAQKSAQVSAAEEELEEVKKKLDELKRELDELMKENEELISEGGDP